MHHEDRAVGNLSSYKARSTVPNITAMSFSRISGIGPTIPTYNANCVASEKKCTFSTQIKVSRDARLNHIEKLLVRS